MVTVGYGPWAGNLGLRFPRILGNIRNTETAVRVNQLLAYIMSSNSEQIEAPIESQREAPLCLYCLRPVDPLDHYCPHCGEAVGQLTPYIPFVNIRWMTRIWDDIWQQLWSKDTPVIGRLLRFVMIVLFAPILLVGIPFMLWSRICSRVS